MKVEAMYEEAWQRLFADRAKIFVAKMEAENVPFEWVDERLDELKAFSRNRREKEVRKSYEGIKEGEIQQRAIRIFSNEIDPLFTEKESLLRKETAQRPENVVEK